MTLTIYPVPTLKDNYVWIIINESEQCALVVDPGESQPVIDYLKKNQLNLRGVFITHHHWDHTNGIAELVKHYPVPVFASTQCPVPSITHRLSEHQTVNLDSFPSFRVIDIPGHTLDHIAYYAPGILFCGDTLFSAGCGRIFEGTAEQLYSSLQKIMSLPDDTQIYCAHEYTLNNLRFSQQVEPDNIAINQHMRNVTLLRHKNEPTLPSRLKLEKEMNPFLRCHISAVIQRVEQYAEKSLPSSIEVFKVLRQWKDSF